MAIFRTKNYVPEIYVAESRDFQLFLKVLDFVQNSIKYDIDTMICSLSTEDMPSQYLDRLKSKLGFYTDHHYDERSLRLALTVFPFIIRYKGSRKGITMCVNAFLKYIGVRGVTKIDIYNEHETYAYTVRIGVPTNITNTTLLTDLLSYILPPGYLVEIYFYKTGSTTKDILHFVDDFTMLVPSEVDNTSVRVEISDDELQNQTYSTTQLGMIYDPTNIANKGEKS